MRRPEEIAKSITAWLILVMTVFACIALALSSFAAVERIKTERSSQETNKVLQRNSNLTQKSFTDYTDKSRLAIRKCSL
jgi:hypothetical protein